MSYVRVGILGASPLGEVWSINPVFDPTGEFPDVVSQVNLDAAAVAIANLSPGATLLTYMSTSLTITGARVEVRSDTDDHLVGISIAARSTPLVGTTTPRQPAQAAIVTSLRTDTPGGSGRGRLYWPAVGAGITNDLRLTVGDTGPIAAGMKTYLAGMASALATAFPLIGFDLAVRSRATRTTPHVVRIQVGNIVDTQRRRRDNYPESYSTVSIP